MKDSLIAAFVKRNLAVLGVFLVALTILLWFTSRMVLDAVYFSDPRHRNEPLKGWMTPRYIAMSYDVPRSTILSMLELSPEEAHRLRARDVAARMEVSLDELNQMISTAVETYRRDGP